MIINATNNNVVVSNDITSMNFKVKASAKAFKILSSNIYRDKISAPIRELICNAVDSHVAAKNNKPVIVHLPTELEPTFYVQDFGTGLSDKEINSLYTTYFDSNKTDSNDYTGALGLGSKSPFCYIDTFNVVSIKNGKKGTYVAFIDEQGMPSITTMSIVDTKEPNGVKVEFAVKQDDFWSFERRLADFAYYCNFPLQVLNGTLSENIYELEENQNYKHKNFVLCDNQNQQCGVIQGNVFYPINFDTLLADKVQAERLNNLVSKITANKHSEIFAYQLKNFCNNKVFLANIGEIDFTASREEISYDKNTCKVIMDKIIHYMKSVLKEVEEIKNRKQSKFDLYCSMQDLYHQEYMLRYLFDIDNYIQFKRQPKKNERRLNGFCCYFQSRNKFKLQQYTGDYSTVRLFKDMRVILVTDKKEMTRMRDYVNKENSNSTIWVFFEPQFGKKEMKILRAIFGGFDKFENSTDIEWVREKKSYANKVKAIRYFTNDSDYNFPFVRKSETMNGSECVFHCLMNGRNFAYDNTSYFEIQRLALCFLNKGELVLCCSPKSRIYDKNKDLITMLKKRREDFIKDNAKKIATVLFVRYANRYFSHSHLWNFLANDISCFAYGKKQISEVNQISGTIFEKRISDISDYENVSYVKTKYEKMVARFNEQVKKYPLLKHLDPYKDGWKQAVKEYIALVNKSQGNK